MTIDEAERVEAGDLLVVKHVPNDSVFCRYLYQVGDIVVADATPPSYHNISNDHYGVPSILLSIKGVPGKSVGTKNLGPYATYLSRYEETWWDIWTQ